MKNLLIAALLLLHFFLPTQTFAKDDIKSSSDHPLISRYPGFYIQEYKQFEYDEGEIMTGLYDDKNKIADTKVIEGKVTNIKYLNKSKDMNVTALQLYKNYEKALMKLKPTMLLACRGARCFVNQSRDAGVFIGNWFLDRPLLYKGLFSAFGDEFGILTAKIPSNKGGQIYVMITVGVDLPNKRRTILMSFIEPETLETDKVSIGSPDDIKKSIEQLGKMELAGIFFDHNKATIKPESKNTLDVIANYLSSNTSSKYFVVGHTDNTGSLDHNMNLSRQRADAVVGALVKLGINNDQISAMGVGPLSPNAPNRSEEGEAQNRRVELVEN
jgi:hypothetical protein